MALIGMTRATVAIVSLLALAACGGGSGGSGSVGSGLFGGGSGSSSGGKNAGNNPAVEPEPERETIWDLFGSNKDSDSVVGVNKFIWQASLEVLDFLPIQNVDPFTGIIVTGFGTPPGGGRAYRATIFVQDPALDARSLNVSLVSKSGPVDVATQRAIEDAILTRARQLRIAAGKL